MIKVGLRPAGTLLRSAATFFGANGRQPTKAANGVTQNTTTLGAGEGSCRSQAVRPDLSATAPDQLLHIENALPLRTSLWDIEESLDYGHVLRLSRFSGCGAVRRLGRTIRLPYECILAELELILARQELLLDRRE